MNFELKGFSKQIFLSRHAAHENEPWEDACKRVAWHIVDAESGNVRQQYFAEFYSALVENRFMPGGRIWYGSGKAKGQLLNCFVIPTEDSREGWGQTMYDSIVISGTGGGVGLNCSPIRPRNSPIRGTGGTATGSVSLMEMIDAAGNVIKAGGGRRTALMLCLNISHPDIIEFLDKKLDLKQLNNANISVVFDKDPEIFFDLVKKGLDFPLVFKEKQIGIIPAAKLWDIIIKNALAGGEPGILNSYLANRLSNIYYHEELTSTNPCGEIWMSPYDCCCLGHLVLPRFVNTQDKTVNWDLLRSTIRTGVRFLDDVLTVNNYPLPIVQRTTAGLRRIGLGVTGLHHMLIMLGYKYSSVEGLEFADKLANFIKNESYEMSIDLAKEKGSFPEFKAAEFLKSAFVKKLKPTIREKIKLYGIRNCALNTIAPTGTISIVCDVSSSIEPIFAMAYERRYRKNDELKMEIVSDPLFSHYVKNGLNTECFENAYDISIRDHFEMQRVWQNHIDNAVSKTINLPPGTSAEELSNMYMEFLPELKGVTVYPVGSRENQPLTPLSREIAEQVVFDAQVEVMSQDSCKSGVCDV